MGQTATEEQLLYREQQQAAVARLGQVALGGLGLQALMGESVTLLAKHLGVEYAKVLELMPDGSRLLLRAGVGWREGLVGHGTVGAGTDSQAGFTLLAQEPVIVSDLRAETRFSGPPLLHDHGVISGMSAVIPGRDRPYGVLGIHTSSQRTFTEYDVNFLLSTANVLAMAVERHAMEMELRQSRDQLKAILGGVADGITAQDESGQVVYANDAAAGLIGAPDADGLVSSPVGDLVGRFRILDTEGNPFPTEELPGRRALRGEEAAEALLCYQRQDTGELRWAQVKATPVRDDGGRPRLAINTFRDVTDSREAEEALRASEARYRGLYGAIEAGVVVHDKEGRIVDANDMAAEILGLDLDQMLGKEPMDPSWQATMDDGTPFSGEQHPAMVSLRTGVRVRNVTMGVQLPTGEKRWLLVNSAPVTDGRGAETRGAVATFVDITERKRAEESQRFLADATALLASSLNYETTLSKVARLAVPALAEWCSIHLVADDGRIETLALANPDESKIEMARALEQRYPATPDAPHGVAKVLRTRTPELYPRVPAEMLEEVARDPDHLRALQEMGIRSAMIVPMVARDRILGAVTFISTEPGRHYGSADLAMAEHLARRAALAIENARLYREAREAIRVRNEFFSSVSHDLKTPLTTIKGTAQLLARQLSRMNVAGSERLAEGLANIDAAAARMTRQIDELLDLSRLQVGRAPRLDRQSVGLLELVQEVVEQARKDSPHIPMRIEAPRGELTGLWDRLRLSRALANLVSNAAKYSPAGSEVLVTVGREEGCDTPTAYVSVRDHGIGIPAQDLPHLFDGFHRGANVVGKVEGTGVGLASVRQIAALHGGTISVESQEGVGSTFTIRLPLAPESLATEVVSGSLQNEVPA